MALCDYAIERRAMIHNVILRPLFQNNCLTPYAVTYGKSGDISNICTFGYYEWVYYRDNDFFSSNKDKLGRVLGLIRNEGNEIDQAVPTSKGTVVPRRIMRKITKAENIDEKENKKRTTFDEFIKSKLGDSMTLPPQNLPSTPDSYIDIDDPDLDSLPKDTDPVDSDNVATFEQPMIDHWINL